MSENYKKLPLAKRKENAALIMKENPSRVPVLIQNEKGKL